MFSFDKMHSGVFKCKYFVEEEKAQPGKQGSRKLEPLEPPVPDKSHLVGQNDI
jgi:hypothetical protein